MRHTFLRFIYQVAETTTATTTRVMEQKKAETARGQMERQRSGKKARPRTDVVTSHPMATTPTTQRPRLLEEWEARQTLSEAESRLIDALELASSELPLPDDPTAARTLTDLAAAAATANQPAAAPTTVGSTTTAVAAAAARFGMPSKDEPIDTTQQFLLWYDHVEARMERSREDVYLYVLALFGSIRFSSASLPVPTLTKSRRIAIRATSCLRNVRFSLFSVAFRC